MSNEVAEPEEGSEPETIDPLGMARSLQPVIDYYRNKSANVLAANYAETANIGRTISQQMIEAAGIGATIRERLEPMLGLKE
ncbi:hypothetical protein [Streptomyces sp. NPDC056188]|uniref:hypothetical protein n=1 Tax=Streptomyces sp. NPDC056188 TaxID=3345740 RepID=UPI0035DB07BF